MTRHDDENRVVRHRASDGARRARFFRARGELAVGDGFAGRNTSGRFVYPCIEFRHAREIERHARKILGPPGEMRLERLREIARERGNFLARLRRLLLRRLGLCDELDARYAVLAPLDLDRADRSLCGEAHGGRSLPRSAVDVFIGLLMTMLLPASLPLANAGVRR